MVQLRKFIRKADRLRNNKKPYTPLDFAKALSDPDLNLRLGYAELLPGKQKSYLSKIIETAYHVSLQTDEGRPLKFNLVYHSLFLKELKQSRQAEETPFRYCDFDKPRLFNQQEVRKLGVCNPETSAIWIGLSEDIPSNSETQPKDVHLEIRGFVLLGEKWLGSIYGFSNDFYHNLEPLVIRVEGPGWIDVYLGSLLAARLKNGSIYLSLPHWAGNLNVLNPLVKDGFETFKGQIWYSDLEEAHDARLFQEFTYHRVLLAMVNTIQLLQHGGVLIVSGHQEVQNAARFLNIKYSLQAGQQNLRQLFLKFLNARYTLVDTSLELAKKQASPTEQAHKEALYYKTILARKELMECCQVFGGLASTDGAILMDTALNIIGFSSEIRLSECAPLAAGKQMHKISGHLIDEHHFRQLKRRHSQGKDVLATENYGMRHRSAIQLSLALKNAAIFVVSQDGNVNLLWDQGGQNYFWEDFDTKNMPFELMPTLFTPEERAAAEEYFDPQ